jgi:hypothetical protein
VRQAISNTWQRGPARHLPARWRATGVREPVRKKLCRVFDASNRFRPTPSRTQPDTSRSLLRPVDQVTGSPTGCGGSRIRTLEGISRRIYSPLPGRLERRRTLKSPACAPITTGPARADDRGQASASGPPVGRLSRRNNAQQRDTTLTNDEQFLLASAGLAPLARRLAWSPIRSCQSMWTVPSPGGQTSGIAQELLRLGQVGRVWHPAGLPQGLPHGSPGAEPNDARTTPAEGCPRAAAWSGYARPTGCHTPPASKIVSDHIEPLIVWTLYGHKTHPDNQK